LLHKGQTENKESERPHLKRKGRKRIPEFFAARYFYNVVDPDQSELIVDSLTRLSV
jgi:hypothetical protein